MQVKKILIADDHPIFRHGLCQLLKEVSWLEVVGEAETGDSALAQIKYLAPDLVLLDIAMPGMDGLKVLEKMSELELATVPVVVTSYDDGAYLERAFDLGARGYVLKDAALEDIISCLQSVVAGGFFVSPSLGHSQAKLPVLDSDSLAKLTLLTPMELKILSHVADFKTSKQVARIFDISPRTVQNHRANICHKLNLHGMHQLMNFARANRDHLPESPDSEP